jgi:hypothetical protein
MATVHPRDLLGHRWGTPYRGHQTCQACGIPDTSSRASELCRAADARLAAEAEANAALTAVLTKYPTLMQRLASAAGAETPAQPQGDR